MATYYGRQGSQYVQWSSWTNDTGKKVKITSVSIALGTLANGQKVTDGIDCTGNGGTLSVAVAVGSSTSSAVSAGAQSVTTQVNSYNGLYPIRSQCSAYTFTLSGTCEVDNADTVYIYWANANSCCSAAGDGSTGSVLCIDPTKISVSYVDAVTNIVITYNANGGTFSTGVTSTTDTVTSGNNSITSITPSRTGHSFSKWNTASDGTGTSYTSGQSANFTSNKTLYAVWTANQYNVGLTRGAGIASVSGGGSYYYQATVQISCTLSTGYNWNNWTGSATYATQTASFKMPANDVSLTANGVLKTYTVSYNANGGSNPPASQTKTHFTDLILTSSTPTAKYYTITYDANGGSVSPATKKVNCTFNNWSTAADGSGTLYNPGGVYSTEASATLYAQWLNVAAGTLATPTYTNAVFVGWYTAISGGDEVTAETEITRDITVYARWRYKIIYNSNGGLDTLPTEYKDYGVSYQLTSAVPEAPAGKEFSKWSTKSDGSGSSYSPEATYSGNAPLVLYAIWKTPSYTVTFNPKGGTWADGTTANKVYTVSYGSSVTPPADPTYPGKRFQGWLGSYTNVKCNRTITAMWDRSPIWIMTADGWQKFV